MIASYLKIAWRNLVKNKTFSLLNIAGLALGLSCFILISFYVLDELSYDRFHDKADRIYRANTFILFGGNELNSALTSDMMGQTLKKDYPEVEEYTRIYASSGQRMVRKDAKWINEPRVAFVDSTFFSVFSFKPLAGDLRSALNGPNKVVLSETAARKYFNTTEVIGRQIETDDRGKTLYEVTAVIEDMPRNSHFRYDLLFSMKNVRYSWGEYLSHNFNTYLLLREDADAAGFNDKLNQYILNYCLPEAQKSMQVSSLEELQQNGTKISYSLMPLTDIHLHSNLMGDLGPNGSIQYVYIFGAVSLFILLIACVNFMNLSTARSANRSKEVGIRKVLGTNKALLIRQFLTESILLSVMAALVAVVIALMVLSFFNALSAKEFRYTDLLHPGLLSFLLVLPFVVGVFAGAYPAFYLSAFHPIMVLKGRLSNKSAKSGLRNGLVVFQFATSVLLIIGTVIVYQQLNYMQNRKLGFNKDNVLIIDEFYALGNKTEAFKQEMLAQSGVKSATISGFLPVANSSRGDHAYSTESVMSTSTALSMQNWRVDPHYIPTMDMELVGGRNFNDASPADSSAVILNETAARLLGPGDPVGKKIYDVYDDQVKAYDVIGVVKDFNYESMRKGVFPLGFFLRKSTGSAAFKVNTAETPSLVAHAEAIWNSMAPGLPFSYRFMDDAFAEMYRTEQRIGAICLSFAGMAIVIACLGLFGLAAFMTEQRTKEVGVRKVLGASVGSVVGLLSKDFLLLVLAGVLIASPLAWWLMDSWLAEFAYRITISWWVFALAGLAAFLIALLTVSFQAIKAAIANPVKSLRTE